MAFLSRKKEEDALKSEQVLLDATLMQNLQDRFCDANNLYLRCLDKNRTEVTKTYGSKEELEYLGSVIDMDRHIGLLERLLNSRIESVIEEDCGADGIRMCKFYSYARNTGRKDRHDPSLLCRFKLLFRTGCRQHTN